MKKAIDAVLANTTLGYGLMRESYENFPATNTRKKSGGRCRIRAWVFVAGVRGRLTWGAPKEEGTAIMKLTTMTLDLVEVRADAKGVMIQVYRPAGRPRYATG
jgi:hypothetical protein